MTSECETVPSGSCRLRNLLLPIEECLLFALVLSGNHSSRLPFSGKSFHEYCFFFCQAAKVSATFPGCSEIYRAMRLTQAKAEDK